MKAETAPNGDVPFYKIGTFGKTPDAYISREKFEEYRKAYSFPKKGDVLISAAGTIGRTVIYDGEDAYYQDSNIVWVDNDESIVLNRYLFYCYQLQPWAVSEGGTIARLYNDNISKAKSKYRLLQSKSASLPSSTTSPPSAPTSPPVSPPKLKQDRSNTNITGTSCYRSPRQIDPEGGSP